VPSNSSEASSSISVVSVPFDVTGDGPTISLIGLISCAPLGERPFSSIKCGRRLDDSDELRADLHCKALAGTNRNSIIHTSSGIWENESELGSLVIVRSPYMGSSSKDGCYLKKQEDSPMP
jgi:hypothetical protein